MNIESLYRSSLLELATSRRIVMFLYALVGTLILFSMLHTGVQTVWAYVELGEFDVPPGSFVLIALLLFLPYWLTGALIWRAIIRKMLLFKHAKRSYTYARYDSVFTPAEAGILVDGEYGKSEVVATLVHMHFEGVLRLDFDGTIMTLYRTKRDARSFSAYESYLVDNLLRYGDSMTFRGVGDVFLLEVFRDAHKVLVQDMVRKGYLQGRKAAPALRIVFRVFAGIGAVVAGIFVKTIFEDMTVITNIMYPRYPLAAWQVAFEWLLILFVLGIVATGFRVRFSRHEPFSEAVGFYVYMKSVFGDRLSIDAIHMQDDKTVRAMMPYAVAFKLLPADDRCLMIVGAREARS